MERRSDSSDIEHTVCVVQVLPIRHSKQKIVFFKSSSRHLPHTDLCALDRHTHTLHSIHAVSIYYGHVCGLLCRTMEFVLMCMQDLSCCVFDHGVCVQTVAYIYLAYINI